MAGKDRTAEQVLARIARTRHGVATRELLLRAGLTRHEIDNRLRTGALIPVHRGVLRVGHAAPSPEATYLAAALACGRGALLGERAAAWLLRIARPRTPPPPMVWTPTERRVPGVRCRRSRRDMAAGRRIVLGIPTVSAAHVLVDLAGCLPSRDLALACHEAGVRYRTTPRQVRAVLPANARGAGNLIAVIGGDVPVTLSRLERRFRRVLREAELPLPVTNKVASGRRVDCRWPGVRLTVELDSYTFHHTRVAWERDHRREREAYARGDQFRRYNWGDVFEDPTSMLRELRGLLS